MKKYKKLVVSSLMAAVIISFPLASFAEGSDKNNNEDNKVSVEINRKDDNSNSIWNRISRLFNKNTNTTNNNSLAPSISGITAPTVLKSGEVGTWVINASDPQNSTLSYGVNWGDENNVFSRTFSQLSEPVFVQDATFTHSYSKEGTYTIIFTVSNSSGKETTSKVTVHVIGDTINAPVITNLLASKIKQNKATVTWSTDVKANSAVWVSKTTPVDTSINSNASRKALVLNHKIELRKLDSNTTYYVVVESTNNAGTATSAQTSFTTLSDMNDALAPVITSLDGPKTVVSGENTSVTVNAYDPKNEALSYMADWGDVNTALKSATQLATPIFIQGATFSHIYNSTGTYTATFTVQNSDGKKDSSSMKIVVTSSSVDTTKPIISGIKTTISSTESTISWTTDEPSTSEVFYSLNTPVDVNAITTPSVSSKLLVKNHSIKITGLTSGTIYHFVIKSADVSNNTAITAESAFITNL